MKLSSSKLLFFRIFGFFIIIIPLFVQSVHVEVKFSQMYWLMGRQSELTIENKLLVYKTILKPIWTYGAPVLGSASTSNI
jgi:hypothetical protein